MKYSVDLRGQDLARFGFAISEGSCCAAVLLVPVLCNPHAFESFLTTKNAFLINLGILALAGWLLAQVMSRRMPAGPLEILRHAKSFPALVALLFLGLASGLSTALSVSPSISFWGFEETSQGTLILLVHFVFFGLVCQGCQKSGFIDNLVTSLILASIPVALLAIGQHFGLDPMNTEKAGSRVSSFSGHPGYLAGYLGLIIPVTLGKICVIYRGLGAHTTNPVKPFGSLIFHSTLAVLQIVSLFFTQGRGPILALLISGFCFVSGLALLGRKKILLYVGSGLLCFGLLFLILLNWGTGPFAQLKSHPSFIRYASIFSSAQDTDPFRTTLWGKAFELSTKSPALVYPEGGSDPLHRLRFLIGYGPETLAMVLPQHFSWNLPGFNLESRFHNLTWDQLYTGGVLGLTAFLSFLILLFLTAFNALGVLSCQRSCLHPLLWAAASICTGAVLLMFWKGSGYVAPGLVLGLAAWVLGTLLISALFPGKKSPKPITADLILLLSLVSAMVFHLIEVSFAFQVASTALVFWIYSAMIFALASRITNRTAPEESPARDLSLENRPRLIGVTQGTLLLITLLFSVINPYFEQDIGIWDILAAELIRLPGATGLSYYIPLVVIPTWIASAYLWSSGPPWAIPPKNQLKSFAWILAISGFLTVLYVMAYAGYLEQLGPLPSHVAGIESALVQASGYLEAYGIFVAACMALVLAQSWIGNPFKTPGGWKGPAITTFVFLLAGTICWLVSERLVRPAVYAGTGDVMKRLERNSLSPALYRSAVESQPGSYFYRGLHFEAIWNQLWKMSPGSDLGPLFEQAESALKPALNIAHGLNPCAYNLSSLYLTQAMMETDPDRRSLLAQKSLETMHIARIFEPGNVFIWLDEYLLEAKLLSRPEKAEYNYRHALSLIETRDLAEWADIYLGFATKERLQSHKIAYAELALRLYEAADLRVRDGNPETRIRYLSGMARIYMLQGDTVRFRAVCEEALGLGKGPFIWQIHAFLAQIALNEGRREEALRLVKLAWQNAPLDKKEMAAKMRAYVESK